MTTLRAVLWTLAMAAVPWIVFALPAESIPVPADVQLGLFVNIWKLDHNFDSSRPVTLAVIYQETLRDSVSAKDDLTAAVARMGRSINVVAYEVGSQQLLRTQLTTMQADVVYVAPLRAVDIAEIGRICRARRLRSITGVAAYVEAGVAVGIGIRRDRPLIVVNLQQARAEGADFSSHLLALARIVGPL